MAQDLTVNIKTTSDVPQAMDKARNATVSFGKQVDDIGKKFSTAFKDIALGYLAPMVLLNSAISSISAAIEKRKADIKEAMAFAEKGESKYLDRSTINMASRLNQEERNMVEKSQAEVAKQEATKRYLEKGGFMGFGGTADKVIAELHAQGMHAKASQLSLLGTTTEMSNDPEVQKIIAKWYGGGAGPENKATEFKPPQGFSNVVGVGANPVMEAMNAQLEEAKKTNEILTSIASGHGTSDGWITSPAPSRASMLNPK